MIMWDSPLLAIIRNFISMAGVSLLFLALDKPRYSWKKTIAVHALFALACAAAGAFWMLWAQDSYVKYFTFFIFIAASLFFPQLSSDTLLQSLYNISVQMFVHTLQLVLAIGVAEVFFHANPWAEITLMCLYLALVLGTYMHLLRSPYREIASALRDRWRSFSMVSVIGSVFLILYWTRPTFLMARPFSDQLLYICIWGLFLMTHLMMLKNMFSLYRELTAEKKIALVEMSSQQLQTQLSTIQESVESARRIRHDMRHHNMQILQYAEKGCIGELLSYLGAYEKEAESNAIVKICENIAADNILNAYLKKAEHHDITVYLDVTMEKNIAIRDIDLVAMLANLMENAIHGCVDSKKPDPFIDLYIGHKASKLVIYIENTAGEDIVFHEGIPQSVRGGGIGVSSILHSAGRYGGEYDFQLQDGIFSCQLLLKVL